MVIWAETENVASDVGPVVWRTKTLNVCSIRDGATWTSQLDIAHLAGVFVNSFHRFCDGRITINCQTGPDLTSGIAVTFGQSALDFKCGFLFVIDLDEREEAHVVSAESAVLPVLYNPVEPVVAISRGWRVFGVSLEASDDSDRHSGKLRRYEGSVAGIFKGLICDLVPRLRVLTTVTGVEDLITKILIIFVSVMKHDGFSTSSAGATDASLRWSVHLVGTGFLAGFPVTTRRKARHFSKVGLRHLSPSGRVSDVVPMNLALPPR